MSLFSYAGKLRIVASKLACYIPRLFCGDGECCGGLWHAAGAAGTQSSCGEGQVYLRWGEYEQCCGCLPAQIYDPRNGGGMVNTVAVVNDLCCPLCENGYYLPYDLNTADFIGCSMRCCRDGACTDEPWVICGNTGGQPLDGCCEGRGCPILCCDEDTDGNVTCELVNAVQCEHPADPDCETGCVGQCCIDGEPQGMMTQDACDAIDGQWQGLGVETCSLCPCRDPFDCSCCESVTSTAAGLTFYQPRRKRSPQFTDTFRVTVSGHTESSIYIHGIPVGASCDFEVTFLLCWESFNIEPVECGTNFKKLDVKVCWAEEHTPTGTLDSHETLSIHGCETGTIASGSCRPDGCNGSGDCIPGSDCMTTLLHDDEGATTDAAISVYGRMTINSSGTGPLVLTGDITIPPEACSLTIVLTGTNTGLNRIDGDILQIDTSKVVIVEKRGVGTWALAGTNTYRGQLRVINGTLVIAADVDSNYGASGSPFGMTPSSSVYPAIGGTDFISGGTASLLFADGVTIERAFNVIAGLQNVVIGGYSGTSSVASSVTNTLYRDVTFQAASGATVTFSCLWIASGADPTITIGSEGNDGTVVLDNFLPGPDQGTGITAAVIIAHGTARLTGADNRIDPTTPATIGGATLDLDGVSQQLGALAFVPGPGAITDGVNDDGTLVMGVAGSAAISVDGTGHEIACNVTLNTATTITVDDESGMTISGVISGARGLAKGGDGTLTLSAANTYTGTTTINGGKAVAGDTAAFGTGAIVVNPGGTLDKNGFTLANTITNNGGTVIP